jgi:hypothetical protein
MSDALIVYPSTHAAHNFWKTHGSLEEWILPVNYEKFKMSSKIYWFNSSFLDILTGIFKNRKSESGFKPLKGIITEGKAQELIRENAELRNQKGKEVDNNKVKGLEEMLSNLTSKGTKVYVTMSPALAPFSEEPSYEAITNVCKKYNVPFTDYSQDTSYNHLHYFFDNHMNKDGANLFTSHLASDIKKRFFTPTVAVLKQQ